MSLYPIERRKHVRYDFTSKIEYVLTPNMSDEICNGFTLDISEVGLCLYIFKQLFEGQELKIKNIYYKNQLSLELFVKNKNLKTSIQNILPVISYKTATVLWTRKYDNDNYTAGLICHDCN